MMKTNERGLNESYRTEDETQAAEIIAAQGAKQAQLSVTKFALKESQSWKNCWLMH